MRPSELQTVDRRFLTAPEPLKSHKYSTQSKGDTARCTRGAIIKVDTGRHKHLHSRTALWDGGFAMSTAELAPVARGSHMLRNTVNSIDVQPYAL